MDKPPPRSHLFAVRVWEEETEVDQSEWRGRVQLFTSGEVRYFRDWAALAQLLIEMLSQKDAPIYTTISNEEGTHHANTD
jgi:hypothetical protein